MTSEDCASVRPLLRAVRPMYQKHRQHLRRSRRQEARASDGAYPEKSGDRGSGARPDDCHDQEAERKRCVKKHAGPAFEYFKSKNDASASRASPPRLARVDRIPQQQHRPRREAHGLDMAQVAHSKVVEQIRTGAEGERAHGRKRTCDAQSPCERMGAEHSRDNVSEHRPFDRRFDRQHGTQYRREAQYPGLRDFEERCAAIGERIPECERSVTPQRIDRHAQPRDPLWRQIAALKEQGRITPCRQRVGRKESAQPPENRGDGTCERDASEHGASKSGLSDGNEIRATRRHPFEAL